VQPNSLLKEALSSCADAKAYAVSSSFSGTDRRYTVAHRVLETHSAGPWRGGVGQKL